SAYPKKNASTIDTKIDATFPQPNAVAMIIPSTSPMAQPVRQWSVAWTAVRVSDASCSWWWCSCVSAEWSIVTARYSRSGVSSAGERRRAPVGALRESGRSSTPLVLLLDLRERVLAARQRAADLGAVVDLELRVHVARHVGGDVAGEAGDRDRAGRERGDRAARLALLGLGLRRLARARADLDGSAAGGPAAELARREAARAERGGDVPEQLQVRVACTYGREAVDVLVVVDRRERCDRVTSRRDVDPELPVDDTDAIGRVDRAAGGDRDRTRQIGVARGRARVLAGRDRDDLPFRCGAGPRGRGAGRRGERRGDGLRGLCALDPV